MATFANSGRKSSGMSASPSLSPMSASASARSLTLVTANVSNSLQKPSAPLAARGVTIASIGDAKLLVRGTAPVSSPLASVPEPTSAASEQLAPPTSEIAQGYDSGDEVTRAKALDKMVVNIESDVAEPRTKLTTYLSEKIAAHMCAKKISRIEACRHAFSKASNKRYPVEEGYPGYGFSVVVAALQNKVLTVHIDGARGVASGDLTVVRMEPISDEELRGALEPSRFTIPAAGTLQVRVADAAGEGNGITAMYDLPGSGLVVGGKYAKVRVPLYSPCKLRKCIELDLPTSELHLEVKLRTNENGELEGRVRRAFLVVYLRPNAVRLLDSRPSVPVDAGPAPHVVGVSDLVTSYASEEERRASECAASPAQLTGALESLLSDKLGADSDTRLSAHAGVRPIAHVRTGRTRDVGNLFYQMGSAIEPLVAVAAVATVQDMAEDELRGRSLAHRQPSEKKTRRRTDYDLHSPEVLARLLERSGARNVLAGLKRAYACVGSARIPSLFDLLNNRSGLPTYFSLDYRETIEALIKASSEAKKNGAAAGDPEMLSQNIRDHMADFERSLGQKLGQDTMPVSPPGAVCKNSFVAMAIILFIFPGWEQGGQTCDYLSRVASELGILSMRAGPDAHAPDSTASSGSGAARMAPASAAADAKKAVALSPDEPVSPYDLIESSCSAKIEELADALAGSGGARVTHSWFHSTQNHNLGGASSSSEGKRRGVDGAVGSRRYAFLPQLLEPKCVVSRKDKIYFSYGWTHVGLDVPGFEDRAGGGALRALLALGSTPGRHVVLLCLVPALSLSFALGTNAPLSALQLTEGSPTIVPFVSQVVRLMVEHVSTLENCRMSRATVFNRALNAQLSHAPALPTHYPHHLRYSHGKSPLMTERDPRLDNFCSDEPLVSLTDINYSLAALDSTVNASAMRGGPAADAYDSPVTLRVECHTVPGETVGTPGPRYEYTATIRYAHGESASYAIALDPSAFACNADAAKAYSRSKQGLPLEGNSGMFRLINPTDGTLDEYVHFGILNVNLAHSSGRSTPSASEPVACVMGRIYVRKSFYEVLRRSIMPSLSDRVGDTLAAREPQKSAPSDAAAAADEDATEADSGDKGDGEGGDEGSDSEGGGDAEPGNAESDEMQGEEEEDAGLPSTSNAALPLGVRPSQLLQAKKAAPIAGKLAPAPLPGGAPRTLPIAYRGSFARGYHHGVHRPFWPVAGAAFVTGATLGTLASPFYYPPYYGRPYYYGPYGAYYPGYVPPSYVV